MLVNEWKACIPGFERAAYKLDDVYEIANTNYLNRRRALQLPACLAWGAPSVLWQGAQPNPDPKGLVVQQKFLCTCVHL